MIGVRQVCDLTPVLFNVFPLAITFPSVRHSVIKERPAAVAVKCRCDGGAFQLQKLKAITRTKKLVVRNLQYADDAAIMTLSVMELQEELSLTDTQYTRIGLNMNTVKTEVMHGTMSCIEDQIMMRRSCY